MDGRDHSLRASAGDAATVVVFVSNGCPTARAYEERLIALQGKWRLSGVQLVAINSNNASLSPPDTFAEMVRRSTQGRFTFPYLKDADGARRQGARRDLYPARLRPGPRAEGRLQRSH